jgi:hypothetical protein
MKQIKRLAWPVGGFLKLMLLCVVMDDGSSSLSLSVQQFNHE